MIKQSMLLSTGIYHFMIYNRSTYSYFENGRHVYGDLYSHRCDKATLVFND